MPIIAFTKDWNDVPTCTTHILREMGKTMPVLWVESIGMRGARLNVGGGDWRRIVRRLGRLLSGAEWKEHHLWVLAPFLMPKPTRHWQRVLNRLLFRLQEHAALRKMRRRHAPTTDLRSPTSEYWSFLPNTADLLPRHHPASRIAYPASRPKVIYYCVDDWSKLEWVDRTWVQEEEKRLLQRADVVFATSRILAKTLDDLLGQDRSEASAALPTRPSVIYMPHGVEHAKFAKALSPETSVPAELDRLPRPRIGFYGAIHPWIDFGLLEFLADSRPDWSFVLVGPVHCEVPGLRQRSNIHLMGRREHDELPAYCRGFDAGVIPYDLENPRMDTVNPVKAREMLAAGLPLVAADLPELRELGDSVICCRSRDEWIPALERQIGREDRASISERVHQDDWARKIAQICGHMMEASGIAQDLQAENNAQETIER